ncbi:hypothetical protein VIGAN_04049400 [Vigna angularis var. angularis]|uniref:Uncharacterized protein n=1 Tax=Vigna angularis var. angularis TaxID=157739 RepID=A0A0S3RS16_PHAAN|nr:hypothetical protein VIGAN_04049400 [Vigna angularis var. angularis]
MVIAISSPPSGCHRVCLITLCSHFICAPFVVVVMSCRFALADVPTVTLAATPTVTLVAVKTDFISANAIVAKVAQMAAVNIALGVTANCEMMSFCGAAASCVMKLLQCH